MTRSRKIEVLIRGAGPAGIAAATWLATKNISVALVARPRRLPLDRIEALGPDIVSLLERIGLSRQWLSRFAQPVPGTVSRWASPKEEVFDAVMSPHGPAWSTRRDVFDRALLAHARQQGVQVIKEEIRSDLVITAVGTDSCFHGQINDKLVGLTRVYNHSPSDDKRLRIEAVPQGWWYALPTGDHAMGVGLITDHQILKGHSVDEFWNRIFTGPIRNLVANPNSPGPLRATAIRCSIVSTEKNRIGSARVSYDPLTGRGVVEAIRNALETVSNLEENQGKLVQLEEDYQTYLEKREQLYRLGATRFGTGFWQRRLCKVK